MIGVIKVVGGKTPQTNGNKNNMTNKPHCWVCCLRELVSLPLFPIRELVLMNSKQIYKCPRCNYLLANAKTKHEDRPKSCQNCGQPILW